MGVCFWSVLNRTDRYVQGRNCIYKNDVVFCVFVFDNTLKSVLRKTTLFNIYSMYAFRIKDLANLLPEACWYTRHKPWKLYLFSKDTGFFRAFWIRLQNSWHIVYKLILANIILIISPVLMLNNLSHHCTCNFCYCISVSICRLPLSFSSLNLSHFFHLLY